MKKLSIAFISILLVSTALIIFTVSASGCPKRTRDKVGSSNYNTFTINAPSNLTATKVAYTQINLSWQDNSNNEDGFEIERRTFTTQYSLLATVTTNTISYFDSSIIPSNTYYYRVKAFTIVDRSAWSNIASATIFPSFWVAFALGQDHTIALATDNSIWTWGDNDFGQLGLGDYSSFTITNPTLMGNATDWSGIGAGYYHTLAIKTNNTLWAWGANESGQLGLGTSGNADPLRTEPAPVGTASDWLRAIGGSNHTLALKTNGTIWSCGFNRVSQQGSELFFFPGGQLGLGDTIDRNTLTQIGTNSDWFSISAGGMHSIALKTDGSLWTWGINWYGQLGLGYASIPFQDCRTTPSQVGTNSDWAVANAGFMHTLGCKTDGTLWAWGQNDFSQLGLGDTIYRTSPTAIGTDSDWNNITAGISHTIGHKTNDTIWAWGLNSYGQLGLGATDISTRIRNKPTQITNPYTEGWIIAIAGGYHSLGVNNNQFWLWGLNQSGQLGLGDTMDRNIPCFLNSPNPPSSLIITITTFSQIDLGWIDNSDNEDGFTIERKINRDGTYAQFATVGTNVGLWSDPGPFAPGSSYYYRVRAYNVFGESGYSNEVSTVLSDDWSKIAAGTEYSIGIKTNGTIWGWGAGNNGQLGIGGTDDRNTPAQIGTDSGWLLAATGTNHVVAIKTNNVIWAWGYNNYGQLGLGDTDNRNTPTQIEAGSDWTVINAGNSHTLGCKTDGTLWAWGKNDYGQLGLDGTIYRTTPTAIGTASDWDNMTCGSAYTIGHKTNGTIWAWGSSNYGQLGLGDNNRTTPSQILNIYDWSFVSAGSEYTVGIKTDRTIWSWGQNNSSQLGLGIGTVGIERTTPSLVIGGTTSDWAMATTGFEHTIALKTNGTLWAWGNNTYYQLGDNSTSQRYTPKPIGTNSDWAVASSGYRHTMAIKINHTLWAWGQNNFGQLGDYTTTQKTTPKPIGTNSDWAIVAGYNHTIVIKTNKTLWSWGSNSYGQLGLGDSGGSTNRISPTPVGTSSDWTNVSAGDSYSIVQKTNGTLWACGCNNYGQLGLGDTDNRWLLAQIGTDSNWDYVKAGYTHAIARKTDGSFWVWGQNIKGKLGIGDDIDRLTPSLLNSESDWLVISPTLSTLTVGGYHTLGIKTDGSIWSWGINSYGQLGLGSKNNNNILTPTQIGIDSDWSIIVSGSGHNIGFKTNRTIWVWGKNSSGQLGLGNYGTNTERSIPTQVGTESDWITGNGGDGHTLAVKANGSAQPPIGTLWAWGANGSGQLGLGDYSNHGMTPTQVGIESNWTSVTAGDSHSLALKPNGTLWSWGYNSSGQLGLGDDTGRNTPALVEK